MLCTEDDVGNVENTFWYVDVTNVDGFDWQTTSSQRHDHVNRP